MKVEIDNFIGVFENAFSSQFCNQVIDEYEKSVKAGFGKTRQEHDKAPKLMKEDVSVFTNAVELDALFFSSQQEFNKVFWDECYPHYAEKYSVLNYSDRFTIYQLKVQKTLVGSGYHVWHYESGSRATCQRLMFFILYLNDVDEGGETEFLYLHKRVKPKQGTLILAPAAFTHTHRGNPPLTSTKYIMTGWLEF